MARIEADDGCGKRARVALDEVAPREVAVHCSDLQHVRHALAERARRAAPNAPRRICRAPADKALVDGVVEHEPREDARQDVGSAGMVEREVVKAGLHDSEAALQVGVRNSPTQFQGREQRRQRLGLARRRVENEVDATLDDLGRKVAIESRTARSWGAGSSAKEGESRNDLGGVGGLRQEGGGQGGFVSY